MSEQKSPAQQSRPQKPLLTAKNIKDIKMSIASFSTMLFLLCHYAWIMRQWVLNPNLPTSTMVIRFSIFLVNATITIGLLMNYIYTSIYAEELRQEALEKKAFEKKSD